MSPRVITFQSLVRLLHESTIYCVVKINARGEFDYMNDHFQRIYAHLYHNAVVYKADVTIHPFDRDISKATLLKCQKSPDKSFLVNLKMVDGDGGYITTSWEYRANVTKYGNIDGIIGIGRDMTAFESSKDHVHNLTSVLNNVAMQQSHAIRRPLANVVGLITLLNNSDRVEEDNAEIINRLQLSAHELMEEFDTFMLKNF